MKTPDQRGPYGRWLLAARLSRDLTTAEEARQALAAAGIHIAKSTYAEYESGTKQPSKNHLPELERFFGQFADPVASPAVGDTASGLADLVAAVTALVAELAADRLERAELRQERDDLREIASRNREMIEHLQDAWTAERETILRLEGRVDELARVPHLANGG